MPPGESRVGKPPTSITAMPPSPPLRPKARLVLSTSVRAVRGARHQPHMQRKAGAHRFRTRATQHKHAVEGLIARIAAWSSTHPWIALTASALVVASTFTISLVVDTRQATETPPLNHEKLSPRTDPR